MSLIKRAYGCSLRYLKDSPNIHSMTLDHGDVQIAKNYLQKDWSFGSNTVSKYEAKFRRWNGSNSAFAFMSGREALSACIHALALDEGDNVIIPAYTCVVVPNSFKYRGINILYTDIELDTFGIDSESLQDKISNDTDAILLQHLYGLVARDYSEIIDIANEYDVDVIEDCAHSTGAEYENEKVGNKGDVAFYSSERSKVFATIQGGVAITNRDDLAKGLNQYYQNASWPKDNVIENIMYDVIDSYNKYKHPYRKIRGPLSSIWNRNRTTTSTTQSEIEGKKPDNYGRKMPSPIAALGLNQLKKIDHYNNMRRQNAREWKDWAKSQGYRTPVVLDDSQPVYLRYPVFVEPEKKRDLLWANRQLGVQPGVWFKGKHHPKDVEINGCPNANKAVKQCINLPCLYPEDRYDN